MRLLCVLAQAVDDQVEVAGAARMALGLRAVDVVLERLESDHVLRGFDAHGHLVAVIGAGAHQPVDGRADERAEDLAFLSDATVAFALG
jgi:hypothetical protein